jgi:quinol monooxygenase YgiN
MDSDLTTPSPLFLLAIRGTLASSELEASRRLHNNTAGVPASVAAAQSLGDLSHMVHIPVEGNGSGTNEFLILDLWNSLEGLNKFFSNPQVQEEAGRIFSARDPGVWAPAQGFTSYHIPAPYGKNERIVAIARGTLRNVEEARALHNKTVADQINRARKSGSMAHEAYAKLAQPGSPDASEFLFLDVWMNAAGMNKHYQDPEFLRGFSALFASPPATSAWVHPLGDWVEW